MQKYNAIVVLNKQEDKMLMCKRRKNPYKGLLNFVGGKREQNESGLDAAYRELEEETAITKEDIKLVYLMELSYPFDNCDLEIYVGKLNNEVAVDGDENELVWTELDQNFFDTTKYAGEGNIGHIMLHVKRHKKELTESEEKKVPIQMETSRLILREMNMSDYDALYAVLADSDIMQHYPYTFDEKRVRGWIDKNRERYRIFGFGLWAVCLKETGEMIGDCGLTMQNINGAIKPEIEYHIRADRQRNGYAKEAAIAVRDWTFEHTPFSEIYSYMNAANVPSAKTAAAYGGHEVEQFEDEKDGSIKVFRMTREEWKMKAGRG